MSTTCIMLYGHLKLVENVEMLKSENAWLDRRATESPVKMFLAFYYNLIIGLLLNLKFLSSFF
jgi:hypothetical protein